MKTEIPVRFEENHQFINTPIDKMPDDFVIEKKDKNPLIITLLIIIFAMSVMLTGFIIKDTTKQDNLDIIEFEQKTTFKKIELMASGSNAKIKKAQEVLKKEGLTVSAEKIICTH